MNEGTAWRVRLVDEINFVYATTKEEALFAAIRGIPAGAPIELPDPQTPWRVKLGDDTVWVIDDPVYATQLLVDEGLAVIRLVRS